MAGLTPVCSVECAAAVGKKKAEDMRKQERIEYRRETQAIKAEFQRIEDISCRAYFPRWVKVSI